MFGHKPENNVPNESFTPLEPAIYTNWKLVNVEKAVSPNNNVDMINFTFKGKYNKNGVQYEGKLVHTEWSTDDASKADNMQKRINEIFRATIGATEELLATNTAETFSEYQDWIVKTFTEAKDKQAVDLKVTGQVYNGKRSSGLPKYGGFITKHGTKEHIFTTKELQGNMEYARFVPAPSESAPDVEESGDDLPF